MYKLQKRVGWCRNITCVYCTCMYMTVSGTGEGGAPPPNIFQSGFSDSSKSDAKLLGGGGSLLADCVA